MNQKKKVEEEVTWAKYLKKSKLKLKKETRFSDTWFFFGDVSNACQVFVEMRDRST